MEGGPSTPQKYLIAHRSSQTGDTLHVAANLALDPLIDVIVVHVGAVGTTEGLLNFYRQATDPRYPEAAISPDSATTNKRVKVVYASNEVVADTLYTALSWVKAEDESVETALTEILGLGTLSSQTAKEIQNFAEFKANYFDADYKLMANLGQTTSNIANKFKNPPTADNHKALYSALANKLTARGLASADIIKGTLQVPTFGQQTLPDATPSKVPIVLLWARYTGTNTATGHNPDGDSCVQGQKQINELLTSLDIKVVTVGHGPRGSSPFRAEFDVGEFYKQGPISSDRATQESFFLALMEKYPGRVYQIGQKTGGMDGTALLGMPTIYLEPKGSAAIERMKKWSDGSLPFYRGVIINQPAPAIVRVLRGFIPDTQGWYNAWKVGKDPLLRARARLAAMLFVYPAQMGANEFLPKALPEKAPPSITTKENEDRWRANVTKREKEDRFKSIVEFVKQLPDTDVQEDKNDPASDGKWTKVVQAVSQADLGPGTAGYSDEDLGKIKTEIRDLIQKYSTDKATVIRMPGAYHTRSEAELD